MSTDDLSPALLLAMPQLADPNFHRAVVLLLEHDDDGTFGLVINRPTDLAMSALCETLEIPWGGGSDPVVQWGGPVRPEHGWVLLGEGGIDHLDISVIREGIRFSRSPEVLGELALHPPPHMRVFLGYAGWGPGQLQKEMIQGSWLVAPAEPHVVFESAAETMWHEVMHSLGIDPATLVPSHGVN